MTLSPKSDVRPPKGPDLISDSHSTLARELPVSSAFIALVGRS